MEFSILLIIKTISIGFGIGVAIGMTGIGGGAIVNPALIYLLGLPAVTAVGTGLTYAMVTKIGGTISHLKLKTIRFRRVRLFLYGSIPGVLAASRAINYLVDQYGGERVSPYVQVGIGVVLLFTALILLIQIANKNQEKQERRIEDSRNAAIPIQKKVIAILSGFIIGGLIGATSVGGGVLMIPVFLIFLDASASQAVGSSIIISLVLSGLGGLVYIINGNVNLLIAFFLCLGSLPGVFLGSRLSVKVPEKVLKIVVTVIVTVCGVSLFFGTTPH